MYGILMGNVQSRSTVLPLQSARKSFLGSLVACCYSFARYVHRIKPRALELSVDIKHAVPAYLGERYPIELEITNEDDIDVEIAFVGFVQPGEEGSRKRSFIPSEYSVEANTSLRRIATFDR